MISASCNICGSNKYMEIYDIKISPFLVPSKLVRCSACGFFYANPRLNKKEEEEYYAKQYHEIEEGSSPGYWYERRIGTFKSSLRIINKFIKNGALIDLGCGKGYFMELAKNQGWEVKGVEISDTAVDHVRGKLGLDVFKGNICEVALEAEYFDAATLWNVLDQIYDPRGNLLELSRVLKKGGYIFIRMPNLTFHLMLYKLYRLFRLPSCPAVFHLYSFDKNSVKKLLESAGFYNVIVKTEAIGFKVPEFVQIVGDKREKIIRKLFDMGSYIIYILAFSRIIISPSIFVIARKR